MKNPYSYDRCGAVSGLPVPGHEGEWRGTRTTSVHQPKKSNRYCTESAPCENVDFERIEIQKRKYLILNGAGSGDRTRTPFRTGGYQVLHQTTARPWPSPSEQMSKTSLARSRLSARPIWLTPGKSSQASLTNGKSDPSRFARRARYQA